APSPNDGVPLHAKTAPSVPPGLPVGTSLKFHDTTFGLVLSVKKLGNLSYHPLRCRPMSLSPDDDTDCTRPVPLSWLNRACSPFMTPGWSSVNAVEPLSPCSSLAQWPTMIVRLGRG